MTDLEIIKQIEQENSILLWQLPYNEIYDKEKQQFIKGNAYHINKDGKLTVLFLYYFELKNVSSLSRFQMLSKLLLSARKKTR